MAVSCFGAAERPFGTAERCFYCSETALGQIETCFRRAESLLGCPERPLGSGESPFGKVERAGDGINTPLRRAEILFGSGERHFQNSDGSDRRGGCHSPKFATPRRHRVASLDWLFLRPLRHLRAMRRLVARPKLNCPLLRFAASWSLVCSR